MASFFPFLSFVAAFFSPLKPENMLRFKVRVIERYHHFFFIFYKEYSHKGKPKILRFSRKNSQEFLTVIMLF